MACGDADLQTDPAPQPPPERVLFVGNSFTRWNGGQWMWLEALSAARDEERPVAADPLAFDGFTLEAHWARGVAETVIADGDYDAVILQGDIPETTVASFQEHALLFDSTTRAAGARPIFFMAWAYERLNWISQEEIAEAHAEVERMTGAEVAPVGLAWQRARSERPETDLFGPDREHPSDAGSYLAALVIYSAVYGQSPIDLQFTPPTETGISSDVDAFLRRVAWETVQKYTSR